MCHTFHGRTGEGGKGYRGKDLRVDILCAKCHSRYWAGDGQAGRSTGNHVSTAGNKASFTAQGGIEFELTRSISLTGRVEYMNARIHAKSTVENNVNLDRIDMSLGLCLRLDRLLRK